MGAATRCCGNSPRWCISRAGPAISCSATAARSSWWCWWTRTRRRPWWAAEKLRAEIRRHVFRVAEAGELRVTTSIGVASFDGHPDYAYLIERADRALYRAKRAGRNRAEAA
nr:diguanylate cyclase [Achromobacter sp. DMS1]